MDEAKRKAFLGRLSHALGRDEIPASVEPFSLAEGPQNRMMQNMSADEVLDTFKESCRAVGTNFVEATPDTLGEVILKVIRDYEGGKVVIPRTPEMETYGLKKLFDATKEDGITFVEWDAREGREASIEKAQDAQIGLTFPIMGIAETATIIQPSDATSGRSVGLLPLTHIAVIRTSTIKPRMTQTMAEMAKLYHQDPAHFPSNIVHISGPSNTSDIELVRVVGVHGPINVTFILLHD